jgi:UDP-2,3-diacylglucosamine pyrophosphatase LpxH
VVPRPLNEDCLPSQLTPVRANVVSRAAITRVCRSIWISDFHLGTRECKADVLLAFLRNHEAENLFLVGDIVDSWKAGPSWYWTDVQKAIVEEIAGWRRSGARVEVLPGNHDDLGLLESLFRNIPTRDQYIHRTAEGRRMLVIHGHQLDGSLASARLWKANQTYSMALKLSGWYYRAQSRSAERVARSRPLLNIGSSGRSSSSAISTIGWYPRRRGAIGLTA